MARSQSAPDELLSILYALNLRAGLETEAALGSARDAIRILGERWAGERIYWPATHLTEARAARDRLIRELAATLPLADVAERVGLTVARVSQIVTAGDTDEIKHSGCTA